jgi:hypothetical protein
MLNWMKKERIKLEEQWCREIRGLYFSNEDNWLKRIDHHGMLDLPIWSNWVEGISMVLLELFRCLQVLNAHQPLLIWEYSCRSMDLFHVNYQCIYYSNYIFLTLTSLTQFQYVPYRCNK